MGKPTFPSSDYGKGLIYNIGSLLSGYAGKSEAVARFVSSLVATRGGVVQPPTDPNEIIKEVYEKNTYGFAAVRFVASRVASVPWGVYRDEATTGKQKRDMAEYVRLKSAGGTYADFQRYRDDLRAAKGEAIKSKALVRVETGSHKLFDFLANPTGDPNESWFDSVYLMTAYRELLGYAFVAKRGTYIEGSNYVKDVYAIDVLPTQNVELDGRRSSKVKMPSGMTYSLPYYRAVLKAGHKVVDEWESGKMGIWRYPSLKNRLFGDSPSRAGGIVPVSILNELDQWHLSATQNRGAFGGIAKVKDAEWDSQADLDEESRKFNERLRSVHGGVVLTGSDVEFQQVNMKPTDYSEDIVTGLGRRIAVEFDLPSLVLGDMDKLNHSNYETALRQAYQGKIIPVLDSLRYFMNENVAKTWDDRMMLDYELDDIEALNEDADLISKRVESQFKSGIITRDEARADLGREPSADDTGDLYMTDLGRVTNEPLG